MDIWPPKNGESSTTPQSAINSNQTTGEKPSNRVIMLLGLDPNTTSGLISKAFNEHGLQVVVDYQRDDTIGYVQLHLDIAKEVAERIMSNGGLRIGTDVAILRALEGMEDLMYWSVYAGARIVPARLLGNCKNSGKVRHQRRNNRQNPYHSLQIMELEDSPDTSTKLSRPNHVNHISHIRSSCSAKSPKAKKKKRKAEKTLQKTAWKRVKAAKRQLSFIDADDQTTSDVILRINETNGFLSSPARDPTFTSIEIADTDSPNSFHWTDSTYPSKIKFNSSILSSSSAIIPFGTYSENFLTEKSGIGLNKKCFFPESPIKESPLIASMSEDSPDSAKSETSLIPYNMQKTSTFPRYIDLLSIDKSKLLASSGYTEETNSGNDDTSNSFQYLQSPLFQEVDLKNKDDADEVEERLKNLRLNVMLEQ
ncbi:1578_t:CDS:2 [Acaulospora colombiana]|uniref:1578_t:CDS:1 n=1 Tax=Acaulospora colombiana TaxID=27376 RepID=A0ACA9N8G9_9GLOM|nr:1578_t:CDS:2 [Acaulospora colombiana]